MQNKKKIKSNIRLKDIFSRGIEKSLEGPSANFMSYANSILIIIWLIVILAATLDMLSSLKAVVHTFPAGAERTKEIFKEIFTSLAICAFPGVFYFYLNGFSIHQLLRMSEQSGWKRPSAREKVRKKKW